MGRCGVLIIFAACLACAAAENTTSPSPITLQPGGCAGFEFALATKTNYDITLQSGPLPAQCNSSSVKLSKLYVQDACITTRDNNLQLDSVNRATCQSASDTSVSVCQAVFATGPSSALLNYSQLSEGQTVDSGELCSTSTQGFVYVQNQCAEAATIAINVVPSAYDGLVCATIAGHSISAVGIAMIVVGCAIGVVLLLLLCCCCCCRR